MITPAKLVVGMLCATLTGFTFLGEAIHIFPIRNAPIVTGKIIKREPIRQYSVPRADFTIRLEDNTTEVHAEVQRYLIAKAPEVVRFHYSGDPREKFSCSSTRRTLIGLSYLAGVSPCFVR